MNLEEMSREELVEALSAKQAGGVESPVTSTRVVEIDGLTIKVNEDKAKTWEAFKLLSMISGEINPETIRAMMEVIDMITNVNEDIVVEHCGGATASFEEVLSFASRIIAECYPKK